jgi:hypothetical protein
LPVAGSLKIRGSSAERVNLITLIVGDKYDTRSTLVGDFNYFAIKGAEYGIWGHPLLANGKALHLNMLRLAPTGLWRALDVPRQQKLWVNAVALANVLRLPQYQQSFSKARKIRIKGVPGEVENVIRYC